MVGGSAGGSAFGSVCGATVCAFGLRQPADAAATRCLLGLTLALPCILALAAIHDHDHGHSPLTMMVSQTTSPPSSKLELGPRRPTRSPRTRAGKWNSV